MSKKWFVLVFVLLFGMGSVLGVESTTFNQVDTGLFDGTIGDAFTNVGKWFSAWEDGTNISTTFIKYLFLILVFILAYSALTSVDFPKEASFRVILSIVVGLLFTVVISPTEIIAAMTNYKAAGLTMILFFPVVVLAFFSFMVATKVNAIGIVLQRVIWGMYSVFLFISSGASLFANGAWSNSILKYLSNIFSKIGGSYFTDADSAISLTLFVASIIIFFTMVLMNKTFISLLTTEVTEAKLKRYEERHKQAEGATKVLAKGVDNA